MTTETKWYLVTPGFVREIDNPTQGLQIAARLDRHAKEANGGGSDCWVVRRCGDVITCGNGNGGHCCGQRFIQVGCSAAVDRVINHLTTI